MSVSGTFTGENPREERVGEKKEQVGLSAPRPPAAVGKERVGHAASHRLHPPPDPRGACPRRLPNSIHDVLSRGSAQTLSRAPRSPSAKEQVSGRGICAGGTPGGAGPWGEGAGPRGGARRLPRASEAAERLLIGEKEPGPCGAVTIRVKPVPAQDCVRGQHPGLRVAHPGHPPPQALATRRWCTRLPC